MKARFRYAKAPSIIRRFEKNQRKEESIQQKQASNNKKWFEL